MTGIDMYDAIDDSQYPPARPGVCFAGYVDGSLGDQPDYGWLAKNRPGSPILSITLFPDKDADCLDIENGAATPESAAGWYGRQRKRGIARPCLYASASTMEADVVPAITAAGIARASVRLWTAHYGAGEHICGPKTCGQLSIDADGTQWTDSAMGRDLDQSLLLDGFFATPAPVPPTQYEEIDVKLPVLKQGTTGQAVRNWQALLVSHGLGYMIAPDPGSTVEDKSGVDGDFGPKTEAATKAFQSGRKLPASGVVGKAEWEAALAG